MVGNKQEPYMKIKSNLRRKEYKDYLERKSAINHGSLLNHESNRNPILAKKRILNQMKREIEIWAKQDEL